MFRSGCAALLLLSACGAEAPGDTTPDAPSDARAVDAAPDMGTPSIEGTPVSSFETTACETSVVLELSRQIADEVNCLMPGQLVTFDETAEIQFTGSAVLPYTSTKGRADLYAATQGAGMQLRITSAFRTVAQQYLLYRWFQLGRCGIPDAATPGRSNHESGRAVDVSNYSAWIARMGNEGWSHNIPGDPVHFEHLSSPDIRGADVLAFQKLWNRNAPEDQIAEDGEYGPMTAARLKMAPAEGFGIGALCEARLAEPVRMWPVEIDAELTHAH
ncbi:MAG: M15 family metallopeptidase [Kofleriaceae bacterium]|nr:M15 family metallopeptidase [Kofleriaceae bacterium]